MGRRVSLATDLEYDLEQVPDHRTVGGVVWIFVQGVTAWSHADDDADTCPACGGGKLPRNRYCLRCDRAGLDNVAKYPGEPVGSRLNPDYKPDHGPVYAPADDGLAGGVGRKSAKRQTSRAAG